MSEKTTEIYTVQGADGYKSIDKSKAIYRATVQSLKVESPVIVFLNDKKLMTIGREIFKIGGTDKKALNISDALMIAKNHANSIKSRVSIYLNGLPYTAIDMGGNLVQP